MPKIRGVRPEYWTDEDIVELSIAARLLFIGMWNFACDNGHLDDKPKQLKMRILPADDCDVDELLTELAQHNRITRGNGTITIRKFAYHQKPHKRWWVVCDRDTCTVPEDDPQRETHGGKARTRRANNGGPTVAQRGDHGGPTADGDVEGEGDGELKVTTSSAATAASQKKAPKRATQRPETFKPTQAHIDLAAERGIDLRTEWAKFCDWCDANGKTYKDWSAALRNWIRNARPSQRPADQQTNTQRHLALAHQLAADDAAQQPIPFPQIGPAR